TTYFDSFSSFVFNGKEKDSESDFHYYGARYYASELSTWLSTDPMSDKYPSLTPYNYCVWNPVILVDPDGKDTLLSLPTNTNNAAQNMKNAKILKWMRTLGDTPRLFVIAMHRSPNTVEMSVSKSDSEVNKLTADQLAGRIKTRPNIYTDNLEKNISTIFVLYSCLTGNGENSFGQQLSKELENSIVFAPQGSLWVYIDTKCRLIIDNAIAIQTGDKTKTLKKGKHCDWNIFYKGKKVMSFSHSAPQSWIKSQGGIDKVIENIKRKEK
ncbi:MAG: RHS repeat domain-containing protein, partial [Bacteroidales bacterium]